jgi:hypothetical protein
VRWNTVPPSGLSIAKFVLYVLSTEKLRRIRGDPSLAYAAISVTFELDHNVAKERRCHCLVFSSSLLVTRTEERRRWNRVRI